MAASLVDPARFKTLVVPSKCSIKDFVSRNKLEFKPGKGFYQITKPETIQVYKEIVARRKSDGSFVTGSALRTILGISATESEKFKLDSAKLADFDIFVQSTSYTRVLVAGTEFLYETDDTAPGMSLSDIIAARKKAETAAVAAAPKPTLSKAATVRAVDPPGGPGSPIEIVFCFDTTGSMGGCILEVRKYVQDVIQRLLTDIPTIRICAFAHGDYIDRHKYVTTYLDFTRDKDALCEWVESVETTYGGDWEECYELALHEVRTKLSWTGGTQRALVMIGDAIPHEPHQSEAKLDWEVELDALVNDLGVRIYAVQCGTNLLAKEFWGALGERSGGKHLFLDDFAKVIDLILAICYREQGMEQLQAYEAEVREREKNKGKPQMNEALQDLFTALKVPDKVPSIRRGDSVAGMALSALAPAAAIAVGPTAGAAAVSPPEKTGAKKRKVPAAVGASGSPVKRGRPATASKTGKLPAEKTKKAKTPTAKPKPKALVRKATAAGTKKKVADTGKKPRGRPKSKKPDKKAAKPRGRPKIKKETTTKRSSSKKTTKPRSPSKKPATKRKADRSVSKGPAKKARASSVKGRKPSTVIKKISATKKQAGKKAVSKAIKPRGRPPGTKTGVKKVAVKQRGRPSSKKTSNKKEVTRPRGRPPTKKTGTPKAGSKPRGRPPLKKAGTGGKARKPAGRSVSKKPAGKKATSKKLAQKKDTKKTTVNKTVAKKSAILKRTTTKSTVSKKTTKEKGKTKGTPSKKMPKKLASKTKKRPVGRAKGSKVIKKTSVGQSKTKPKVKKVNKSPSKAKTQKKVVKKALKSPVKARGRPAGKSTKSPAVKAKAMGRPKGKKA